MRKSMMSSIMILSLWPALVHAGGREDFDHFIRDLNGLDGRFTQEIFDINGKGKESSTGRVALSVPRLFRWEYVEPFPQLIVVGGKQVWVYDPDLQQATVRAQGVEEENSPLAALIDPYTVDHDYITAEVEGEGGLNWLELRPKQAGNAGFDHALLGFDANGQLAGCASSTPSASAPRSPSAPESVTRISAPGHSVPHHPGAWTWSARVVPADSACKWLYERS